MIDQKEIRGISLRQVIGYTIAIAGVLGLYFNIRAEIYTNRAETINTREMIEEIDIDTKERWREIRDDNRLDRIQMKALESNQAAMDLRMQLLEQQVKIYIEKK